MTTYPPRLRKQAQTLRSQGLTYREICTQLGVSIPKGTLSYWVQGVNLPSSYYQKIRNLGKECIFKAQQVNKENLDRRLLGLRTQNHELITQIQIDKQIGKLILATLYWCEGGKYPSHRNIQFGSSDPRMIRLFLVLLRTCYNIDESKFRLTVQCRADQDTNNLTKFWTKITGIPKSQQFKPWIDKRTYGKPTRRPEYKGVCRIDYFDANLQCELQFTGEEMGTTNMLKRMKKLTR